MDFWSLQIAKKYAKHWRAKATGVGEEIDDIHSGRQAGAANKILHTLTKANERKYGGMRHRVGGLVERG